MKQVFILLILIIYSQSIQLNSINTCACSQIMIDSECAQIPECVWYNAEDKYGCQLRQFCPMDADQKRCLQLPQICQWNINDQLCVSFQDCQSIVLSANNYKDCKNSNINCLAYNGTQCQSIKSSQFSTNCIDYPQSYCTENVGLDGVCLWNTQSNNCQPITNCNQAIIQSQCQLLNQQNGYACQYINGICTQITNCSVFQSQDTCKYYFPNIQSTTMILCQWTSNTCQNAQNTLYLNSTNCLTSTGLNSRWVPNYFNPLQGICVSCLSVQQNLPIVTKSQCLCSQFILQSDCNPNYCSWNQELNICQDIECSAVTEQSLCATIYGCYWDYQNTGQCATFVNCASLPTQINAYACAAQTIQCPAFSQKVCQGIETLEECSAYTYIYYSFPFGCTDQFGKEGLCISANSLCIPLQNCSQIHEIQYCNSWQNLCEWNHNLLLCEQLTCFSYNNNPSKCTYVITGFQETQYQICEYNKQTGICNNAYQTSFLNAQNCAINTASTYRWTQITPKQGMCASCQSSKIYSINQCSCSQYITETDCQNSGYCTQNDSICIRKTCSEIFHSILCASLSYCYWNQTTKCTNFTECNNLTANNLTECLVQNVSCKGYNSQNNTCSKYPLQSCSTYSLHNCSQATGFEGKCYINDNQCTSLSTCQGLSQTVCNKILLTCYWNSTQGNCQQMQCSQFKTKQQCKFYIEQPNSSSIIICQWNNNQCINASDVMNQLTQQNCRINTGNTYRWIPTQQNKGYCIKCQQQIILSNQCPCKYLYTQNNCYQSQECQWNYQQNICQSKQCNQILIKSICITSTQYCGWNQQTQQCIQRQQINCNQLQGQTQQQCLQQSLNCPGTNGINCLSNLGSCQYYNTEYQCIESYGNDGVCMWDNFNQTCIGVVECSQLPQYLCSIKSYACYYYDNKCQTLTCETLYLNTGSCTHVFSLTSPQHIQICQITQIYIEQFVCVEVNIADLNETQCYSNSGRTARWVPFNYKISGFCETCTNNLIPIANESKCSCQQFLTQNDCYSQGNFCFWNENTCQSPSCFGIQDMYTCRQINNCSWYIDEYFQYCEENLSCRNKQGHNSAVCLAQSPICRGSNGTNCTEYPTNYCRYYQQCQGMIGIDGVCFYEQISGCSGLSNCSQITNLYECQALFANACSIQGDKCQAAQCSNYSTPATCNYVISSLLTGQIQLCQWHNQQCINLISQKNKNYSNCATSTALTYRWVPLGDNITEGYCTMCNFQMIYTPGQCACNQIFTNYECSQNPNCFWSGTACVNAACSSINNQYYCGSNPRCAWSEANDVCQPFTSCSDLAGINAAECTSYSIKCTSVTTTRLHNNKYVCSVQISNKCNAANQFECERTFLVEGGVCVWMKQSNGPSCQFIAACEQLDQQKCSFFPNTCYWNFPTGTCIQITGCYFLSDCTYYFSSLENSSNSLVICYQDGEECNPYPNNAIDSSLTYYNCYQNTYQMYRWSSLYGYCVSCGQSNFLETTQSLCSCSQLTLTECQNQSGCQVYNQTSCIEYSCADYYFNQQECVLAGCSYSVGTLKGCNDFDGCAQIQNATSSVDCITSSLQCPVFNSTTHQCSERQPCNDQKTKNDCEILIQSSAISYCFWNQNNQKCEQITDCGEISDIYLCGLQQNRCQWSVITNSCVPQNCGSLKSQNDCNYIYTSLTKGDIAICQWDSTMSICRSAPLSIISQFTDGECSINTGYNYHFYNDTCVKCQFQVNLIALVVLLQFLE